MLQIHVLVHDNESEAEELLDALREERAIGDADDRAAWLDSNAKLRFWPRSIIPTSLIFLESLNRGEVRARLSSQSRFSF